MIFLLKSLKLINFSNKMGSKFCTPHKYHEDLTRDFVIKSIIYYNKWVVFDVVTKFAEIFPIRIEKKDEWKIARDKLNANLETNKSNFSYNKIEESYGEALARFYRTSEKIEVNYIKTSVIYETNSETYQLVVEVH